MDNTREMFFKGISEMISQFSEIDLKHLKSIISNEFLARQKKICDKDNRIITQPGILYDKKREAP